MDFMAPPFPKSFTLLSFSPSSALQFHLYIHLHSSTWSAPISSFSALFWAITKPSVQAAQFDQKLIRRAGAGVQCESGEAGWAHTTPADHSELTPQHSPQKGESRSQGEISDPGHSYTNGKNIPPRKSFFSLLKAWGNKYIISWARKCK